MIKKQTRKMIANQIRNIREDKQVMTQKQFAKLLQVSQPLVSKLERGDFLPSFEVCYAINKKCGHNLLDLV